VETIRTPLTLDRYNSAFFSSLETNDYEFIYVTEDFVNGGKFNASAIRDGEFEYDSDFNFGDVQDQLNQYEKLQNAACIDAYAVDFVTDRRTLVLVTANSSSTDNSLLYYNYDQFSPPDGNQYAPYQW
jgi:hypothetical protein